MLTIGLLSAVVVGGIALFYYYLFSLTANQTVALRRFKNRDLYARHMLKALHTPAYDALWRQGTLRERRSFSRNVTLLALRNMASDRQELGLRGRRLAIWKVGFYILYVLTWCKAHTWPGKDDARGLIGWHLMLME